MKDLKKLVEVRLAERLDTRLPEFKRKTYRDVPRVTSFVCKVGHDLYFHIVPQSMSRWNAFSTQLCWMTNEKSPIWSRLGAAEDSPNENGLCFELRHLWTMHAFLWRVTHDEDWQIEDVVKKQQGSEYRFDPAGVKYRPQQLDKWISSHPDIYPEQVSTEQRLVWPLVDDMVEKIVEYGVPYFEGIAAQHGYDWNALRNTSDE